MKKPKWMAIIVAIMILVFFLWPMPKDGAVKGDGQLGQQITTTGIGIQPQWKLFKER